MAVLTLTACAGGGSDGRTGAGPTTTPTTAASTSTSTPASSTASTAPAASPTYAFPVQPAARASFGPDHHDYPATDIFAPCGTEVVAPAAGVVVEVVTVDSWSPANDTGETRSGLAWSIEGDDGVRYYGSHLQEIEPGIVAGVRVTTGRRLGLVGRTGNAQKTPCHLHFGLSPPCGTGDWMVRRGVITPFPFLTSWRSGAHLSPVEDLRRWQAEHPDACAGARSSG